MIPLQWRLKKQKYALVGSKCAGCSALFFPARKFCAGCQSTGMKPHGFSGFGVIESFTTIHAPPSGFSAPYVIGLVRLDEGPSIVAQLSAEEGEAAIGKRVSMVFRRLLDENKGGVINYGFKFEVI